MSEDRRIAQTLERIEGELDELVRLFRRALDYPPAIHVIIDTPEPPPAGGATTAFLQYTGDPRMANTQLTVDTVGGKVHVGFLDDKGDVAAAPAGLAITWSSTGSTTLVQDPADPLAADITAGPFGDAGDFGAAFGGTALEADGTTQIADPAPLPYTVGAGGAVSAALTES